VQLQTLQNLSIESNQNKLSFQIKKLEFQFKSKT
jgi:hypothetical protein